MLARVGVYSVEEVRARLLYRKVDFQQPMTLSAIPGPSASLALSQPRRLAFGIDTDDGADQHRPGRQFMAESKLHLSFGDGYNKNLPLVLEFSWKLILIIIIILCTVLV